MTFTIHISTVMQSKKPFPLHETSVMYNKTRIPLHENGDLLWVLLLESKHRKLRAGDWILNIIMHWGGRESDRLIRQQSCCRCPISELEERRPPPIRNIGTARFHGCRQRISRHFGLRIRKIMLPNWRLPSPRLAMWIVRRFLWSVGVETHEGTVPARDFAISRK